VNAISKVSEITIADCVEYLRIPETTAADLAAIGNFLEASKAYVMQFCGLDEDGMDAYGDLVPAVFVQVQDFWDNRSAYADGKEANRAVQSILGLHQRNLL